jgi:hypothetical protein
MLKLRAGVNKINAGSHDEEMSFENNPEEN